MKPKHQLTKERVRELFGVERYDPKGKATRRLTPDEFEATFKVRPHPKMRSKAKQRAAAANEAFSEMYRLYDMSSLTIFRAAADELHNVAIKNMSECPAFVLEYMRKKLEHETIKKLNAKKVARLRSVIEKAEAGLRVLV